MGMVVQHNMQAANANRLLGITSGQQQKSTEKLSSGYKINRGADDAAGLSISEKMRKQIKGLDRASTNAQDGVSAVQTAEGALNEVQSMLQRMNELAVQSANGTNSTTDRTAIQNEIDQLSTEIDRVSETTKFNETYLLKGDKNATKVARFAYDKSTSAGAGATFAADGATTLQVTGVSFTATANMDDQNAVVKALRDQGVTVTKTAKWVASNTGSGAATSGKSVASYKMELNGEAAQKYNVITTESSTKGAKFEIQDKSGNKICEMKVTAGNLSAADSTHAERSQSAVITASVVKASTGDGSSKKAYYDADGNKISENALNRYFSMDSGSGTSVKTKATAPSVYDAVGRQITLTASDVKATRDITGDLTVKLHVGADSTTNNQIAVNIASMSAKSLGVIGLKVDGTSDTNSRDAIETIKEALQKVSDQRASLGAVQNRLEHTIDNLDNVVENTESSESRIRDTDMAEEMVRYSKNNILAQAGQSMLAQANQSNQGVLSILG
jgi:flagellin